IRTPAFDVLDEEYRRQHAKLDDDLARIVGRLAEAPELMGEHVPELRRLALPIFKTRCKDSCHSIVASAAEVLKVKNGQERPIVLSPLPPAGWKRCPTVFESKKERGGRE